MMPLDTSAYPPEFAALLKNFSQEMLGVKDREGWYQEARSLIARYSLAVCLMEQGNINLPYFLQKSLQAMEGITDKGQAREIGLSSLKEIEAALKDAQAYERQLTLNVHALYSRAMSRMAFFRDTGNIIERQLTEAWLSGADEMMVLPEDMTPEDNAYIKKLIAIERQYLDGFADDIQNAAAEGTGWEQFRSRVGLWVERLREIENRARIYFGGRQKLRWYLGHTERHCNKCIALNGIVAWAKEWQQTGVYPHFHLGCDCNLTPTRDRRTVNAVQRISRAMAVPM